MVLKLDLGFMVDGSLLYDLVSHTYECSGVWTGMGEDLLTCLVDLMLQMDLLRMPLSM